MSWIDDEVMEMYDFDLVYSKEEREEDWKRGYHKTKNGKLMLISNMETSHLKNTIKLFKGLDTSPLEEVYYKRDLRKE